MKKGGTLFILILFLLGIFFYVLAARADYIPHLIISEVQTAGATSYDDFIELYNPTDADQNLSGWSIQKVSSTFNYGSVARKELGDKVIKSHGFFLIVPNNTNTIQSLKDLADTLTASTFTLSDNNGIFLVNDNINITDASDPNIIDAVGLGNFPTLAGFNNIPNPDASNSVFRKFINSIPSTFVLNANPTPQNTLSALKTPLEWTAETNQPPLSEAGADQTNVTNTQISFSSAGSSDPEGGILTYLWDFGDGTSSTDANPQYIYTVSGLYNVKLTVSDDAGKSADDFCKITISDPPVFSASSPPASNNNNGSSNSNSSNNSNNSNVNSYKNQYSPNIKIIEFLPDPAGTDDGLEYIKLQNNDANDINLRNWSIDDQDGGSKAFLINRDALIKKNDSLIFNNSETKIALNNDGDSVRLFDPDGKLIDSVSYNGKVPEGAPYILENGTWAWKGRENKNASEQTNNQNKTADKNTAPTVDPNLAKNNTTSSFGSNNKINLPAILPQENVSLSASDNVNIETNNSSASDDPAILIDMGSNAILASTVKNPVENIPIVQTDFNANNSNNDFNNSSDISSPFLYSPYFQIPLMILFSILIINFVVLPQNFMKIINKILKEDSSSSDLAELFK